MGSASDIPAYAAGGKAVSAWHDIPLWAEDGLLNFICEIPKESSAKMEVATVSPAIGSRLCMSYSPGEQHKKTHCDLETAYKQRITVGDVNHQPRCIQYGLPLATAYTVPPGQQQVSHSQRHDAANAG